jgi:taurine dioxygenase
MGRLDIRRLGYALGAEITGLDLRRPLDAATVSDVRRAWLDHTVLCFPAQDLSREEFMAFCAQLGELDDNRATPHLRHPDDPNVIVLVNKPLQVKEQSYHGSVANYWHTDNSYTDRPSTATFLNAKILPEIGGDTLFAGMYAAYDALSPALKGRIEHLEGVHDVSLSASFRNKRDSPEVEAERRRRNPPVVHPVVRVHPETGRKALFVGSRVRNFVGMTEEETKPLLDFLNQHATSYEFVYRHRWTANDLVMWDNRCALHYAVPDYDRRQLRQMLRCSLLPPKSGRVYVADADREPAAAGAPAGAG